MRYLRKSILAVAAVIGGTLLVGFGWRHREFDPERAQKFATHIVDDRLDEVDANKEQRARIHAVKDRLLPKAFALRAERTAMRDELLSFWSEENPDPKDVHAAIDARIEQLRAFAHEAADAGLEIHKTLTPKQRAALAEDLGKHKR